MSPTGEQEAKAADEQIQDGKSPSKKLADAGLSDDLVEELSAKYNLECVLGHGSFGVVMFAQCIQTKVDVAVKVIRNCQKNATKLKKIVSEI